MYPLIYLAVTFSVVACGVGIIVWKRDYSWSGANGAHMSVVALAALTTGLWILGLASVGWFLAPFAMLAWAIAATGWHNRRMHRLSRGVSLASFMAFGVGVLILLRFLVAVLRART